MKFYMPAKIEKSVNAEGKEEMRICGLASTPRMDRAKESVLQSGLDISDFVNDGFFNWNHDNTKILGYPDKTKTKITDDGLYVEGFLLDTDLGRDIWNAAVQLEKSNADRRLGFSIEGKVLKKDKKGNILKAKVMNVAITPTPCNPDARWNAMVKSMSKGLTSSSVLVKESLDHGLKCFTSAINGDDEAFKVIELLANKLNNSKDRDDVKVYLKVFKGFNGDRLEDLVSKICDEEEDK